MFIYSEHLHCNIVLGQTAVYLYGIWLKFTSISEPDNGLSSDHIFSSNANIMIRKIYWTFNC